MAKLVYPSVIDRTYAGLVSRARSLFSKLASDTGSRADAKAALAAQIAPLAVFAGYSTPIPATSKLVASGVKLTAPAISGAYVNGYTLTIVAGVVTAIVAS